MEIEDESICRICADTAHYNIFQDELEFDNRNMKIYIVLNNFLFEKLYGPDEFSDLICSTCCDSLYNSYQFMIQVRDSEHKLQTEGPPPKKLRHDIKDETNPVQFTTVSNIQNEITPENILGEDILETEYTEEDLAPVNIDQAKSPEEESPETSQKEIPASNLKDAVTITNFSIAYKEENDQVIGNIHIDNKVIENKGDGDYMLDKWLENPGDASYFSCLYCVKGFSNVDFLLKHISSCHLCLICFKICETNKDLSQHMKSHSNSKLVCPFCGKVCTYNVYRPHVRKQHVNNMPTYIGVLPSNIMAGNLNQMIQ